MNALRKYNVFINVPSAQTFRSYFNIFCLYVIFLIRIVGGWSPNWVHSAHQSLLAYFTCPGYCEDGKFGRGNQSTRRNPTRPPLCPPQIPLHQTRARTRAAAVGSQRLTAWAMARPFMLSVTMSGTNHFHSWDTKPRYLSLTEQGYIWLHV
jgi:hypothetical protein